MKKRKIIALTLLVAFLFSLCIPGTFAIAEDGDDTPAENKGMEINKTATANDDGTYTITLEAYATGEKITSTVNKDVPTDIVLVLDQSGSMATEDFPSVGETTYTAYTGNQTQNSNLYNKRHNNNGNKGNLYYPLEDGAYATVSVERTQGESTYNYTQCSTDWKNYTGSIIDDDYWKYSRNLYVKNEAGKYQKVIVSCEKTGELWNRDYNYTYEFPNGNTVTSIGNAGQPGLNNFDGNGPVYYLSGTTAGEYTYIYTCTDAEGQTIEIGTSTGADTNFTGATLYARTVTNGGNITRLQALKNAVTGFNNAVAQKAAGKDGILGTEDDIDHRIAVVGFAARKDTNPGDYKNTELFIGATQYKYGTAAQGQYENAFQNMNTSQGQSNVTASIGALEASGGTHIDLGMEMAKGILDNNLVPSGEKRNRVVIVFTDGFPGSGYWQSNDMTYAQNAINYADTLRSSSVNVYSVGIFNGADATSEGNRNGNDTQKANWFMQNLSDNEGTPQTPSYYLSAADSNTLNNIFEQIADNIESGGSFTELGEETKIKDAVSDYFTLPPETTAEDITVSTAPCTSIGADGNPVWGDAQTFSDARITVDMEDGTVSVSGFDFAANYVGMDEFNGIQSLHNPAKKLVISFNVVPKTGFIGGNDVPTNDWENTAVYDKDGNEVEKFADADTTPTVNVPIVQPEFVVNDKTIYEGNTTSVNDLYTLPVYTGDDAWKDDFVTITGEVTDVDGTMVSPTECTAYNIMVIYAPKTTGENSVGVANGEEGISRKLPATIHVLKPVIAATIHDVQKYYGESYTLGEEANGSFDVTGWTDKSEEHTGIPEVEGTAPDSSKITSSYDFEYTTEKFTDKTGVIPKKDFDVTVQVKKDRTIVTDVPITTSCEIPDSTCNDTETDNKYTVHVKTCQLTIKKNGGAAGEPYVFDVYKNNKKYSEVTVIGNDEATIYELPVGTYTIQEDTGWSWRWRYVPSYSEAVNLSKDNSSGSITCTNTLNKYYWLNGYSAVEKNIFGVSHNKSTN